MDDVSSPVINLFQANIIYSIIKSLNVSYDVAEMYLWVNIDSHRFEKNLLKEDSSQSKWLINVEIISVAWVDKLNKDTTIFIILLSLTRSFLMIKPKAKRL